MARPPLTTNPDPPFSFHLCMLHYIYLLFMYVDWMNLASPFSFLHLMMVVSQAGLLDLEESIL